MVDAPPARDAGLAQFLRSLALAWREGEVRPRPRPTTKKRRYWRTRIDPFETTWPRVVTWLETEPERTAQELFDRLRRERPGAFPPGQVRTLQRRVSPNRPVLYRPRTSFPHLFVERPGNNLFEDAGYIFK